MYNYQVFSELNHLKISELQKKYPFLKYHSSSVADYIPANYYNKLLKEYTFNRKSDIEYLEEFIQRISLNNPTKKFDVLELGSGSGRTAEPVFKLLQMHSFDAVDQSKKMIVFLEKKFRQNLIFKTHSTDSITYLLNCKKKYDIVYSLWSYNHSVHQNLEHFGMKKGTKLVKQALNHLFSDVLKPNGSLFIMHVDKLSAEQQILVKQWKHDFPDFYETGKQSKSKQILDIFLSEISDNLPVEIKVSHLIGDPITYQNMLEALEIFLNFHMETEYNRHRDLEKIITSLQTECAKFENNGKIRITPGCFIYEIRKLD